MEIIVNDTNIFIDLHSIGLLRTLCDLPYDVRTVDFVIDEIKDPVQTESLAALVTEGKIKVESFNPEELADIVKEHSVRLPKSDIEQRIKKWTNTKPHEYFLQLELFIKKK